MDKDAILKLTVALQELIDSATEEQLEGLDVVVDFLDDAILQLDGAKQQRLFEEHLDVSRLG